MEMLYGKLKSRVNQSSAILFKCVTDLNIDVLLNNFSFKCLSAKVYKYRKTNAQVKNDLSLFVKSSLSMYADDHQTFHVGNDQSAVALELRETARNAPNWYDSNLSAGNLRKYPTMNIKIKTMKIKHEDKNDVTHTICVNNEEIKTVRCNPRLEP